MQEDCYQCLRTRQWFFCGLSGYFVYEFWRTYPYANWKTFGFSFAPIVLFVVSGGYCYLKAEKMLLDRLKDVEKPLNDGDFN